MTGLHKRKIGLAEMENLPWAKQSTDAEKMTLELDLRKQQEQLKPIIAEQNRKQNTEWKKWKQIKRRIQTIFRRAFLKEKSNARQQIDLKIKMKKYFIWRSVWEMDAMKSKQEKRRSQRMNTKKKCRNKTILFSKLLAHF
jgi:hypothetical protein